MQKGKISPHSHQYHQSAPCILLLLYSVYMCFGLISLFFFQTKTEIGGLSCFYLSHLQRNFGIHILRFCSYLPAQKISPFLISKNIKFWVPSCENMSDEVTCMKKAAKGGECLQIKSIFFSLSFFFPFLDDDHSDHLPHIFFQTPFKFIGHPITSTAQCSISSYHCHGMGHICIIMHADLIPNLTLGLSLTPIIVTIMYLYFFNN